MPLKFPIVIALSGQLGVGKDFIVNNLLIPMLCNGRTFMVISFADHFKVGAIVKYGFPREKVYGKKDAHSRRFLQTRGTEHGRNLYGENVWVNIVRENIIENFKRGIDYFFITDVRFVNEATFIEQDMKGCLIRINAPKRNMARLIEECEGNEEKIKIAQSHVSETKLKDYPFKLLINNDPEHSQELAIQVGNIVLAIRECISKQPLVIFCNLDDIIVDCRSNYITIEDEIKQMFVKEKCTNEEFDTEFRLLNEKRNIFPFSREAYGEIFVKLAKHFSASENFSNLVYSHAMSVYSRKFLPLTGAVEKIKEWQSKDIPVVIVTLGDPIDQLRKLYEIGLIGIKCECLNSKSPEAYIALKNKYPSLQYVMIGDSITHDIYPASQCGYITYLVSHSNPLSRIEI
jgi:FMN phosphatase YigB (HAD superfamily)